MNVNPTVLSDGTSVSTTRSKDGGQIRVFGFRGFWDGRDGSAVFDRAVNPAMFEKAFALHHSLRNQSTDAERQKAADEAREAVRAGGHLIRKPRSVKSFKLAAVSPSAAYAAPAPAAPAAPSPAPVSAVSAAPAASVAPASAAPAAPSAASSGASGEIDAAIGFLNGHDFQDAVGGSAAKAEEIPPKPAADAPFAGKEILGRIRAFFSEFPSASDQSTRFLNTFVRTAHGKGLEAVREYVTGYFELSGSYDAPSVKEKVKSLEFEKLVSDVMACRNAVPTVNRRLEIYYGPTGSGKTTTAIAEATAINGSEAPVIGCNASVEPGDLIKVIGFTKDGRPGFFATSLVDAMRNGKAVVLDEFNTYSKDTLTAFQSYLDDKKEIVFEEDKTTGKKGTIEIKEGFRVIATMNLVINGTPYPLPEAVVDRAGAIHMRKTSDEDALKAMGPGWGTDPEATPAD